MTTIADLARTFRRTWGDPREAAKAESQSLDAPTITPGSAVELADPSVATDASFTSDWGVSPTWSFTTEPPKPVVVPPQPTPADAVPTLEDGEAAAYQRTCRAIGYEPAALVEQEILAFMREKKVKRFDNAKVGEYLTAKAKKALGYYGTWRWRPLRPQDGGPETGRRVDSDGDVITTASLPYQQAIPLRVLARVEQFVQKFGDKVRFLVSDYAEKKPDPFIAVIPKQGGIDPIIFDVWDEPDFK